MRRGLAIAITVLALLTPCILRAQMLVPGLDSAVTAALDSKLDEYFTAIEPLSPAEKIEECDFIIEACTDSLIRQYAAVRVYDHFLGSKVMGDEAVAVHLVDDWFVPGRVSMYSDVDLLNAKVFAQFHRSSLIGMQAPELALRTPEGEEEAVPQRGKPAVLFFYDTSCSRCKAETVLLRTVLERAQFPLDFFAVYTGVYADQWQDFRDTRWNIAPENVDIHHLWDPELESDFQMLYGVLQTPQMLLVDERGTIVGRGLDSEALVKLLPTVAPDEYEYGAQESFGLFEALFEDTEPSAAGILDLAKYIRDETLARGDSTLCRHILGDFLFYLMDAPGEVYKLALDGFIDTYVDGDPSMWQDKRSQDYVVRPAAMMKEMLSRVPYGSKIPKLKLRGVLARSGATADDVRTYSTRRLRGNPSYVIFHSPGCSSCEELLAAVPELLKDEPSAKVLLVDPEQNGRELLDIFDLSVLPHVLRLDKKGTVTGKYLVF
ncbi:MAG: redoxin domain-containing protein [Bacteroidia bacterium]|nr:redoxin domain-containing protein [Bacteroidia bacterium]